MFSVIKTICLILVLNVYLSAMANDDILLYDKVEDGIVFIHCKNKGFSTYTLELTISGKGLESFPVKSSYLIAPQTETELLQLKPLVGRSWSFSYEYRTTMGNIGAVHDDNYVYALPFSKNETYKCIQGYNGNFSHQGRFAIDFQMPIGTPVHAMREGVVVELKSDSDKGCPNIACRDLSNYIIVQHSDESYSYYGHLNTEEVFVKKGDKLEKHQYIANSGHTGFSSVPHLHVEIFKAGREQTKETLRTKFNTSKGVVALEEKADYHF